MPPCGYRPPAVESVRWFMMDNLDYFIDLYEARGITVAEALSAESSEIDGIRRGERGGVWSKIVVELNAEFYKQLRASNPRTWAEVRPLGESIIDQITQELMSLTPVLSVHQ